MSPASLLSLGLATAALPSSSDARDACDWPQWEAYARRFVEGGRVVDHTAGARSTSEGQAYGLFFALVANDARRFDAILSWTRDNLAPADEKLPAWLWGRAEDGRWRVLDDNSATDADLWMAYALLEASRLWARPELAARGRALLARLLEANLRALPGLGAVLLPAPRGFELDEGTRWRLNPSYVVLAQLARFRALELPGPWGELLEAGEELLRRSAVGGHAPDWVVYDTREGFLPDTEAPPVSSYDAIRVPLFAAAFGPSELVRAVAGRLPAFLTRGLLIDRVPLPGADPGQLVGANAPPGYYAALLPVALRLEAKPLAAALRARLETSRRGELYGRPAAYYDQNLALFGRGLAEGRYRFGPRGRLAVHWNHPSCHAP